MRLLVIGDLHGRKPRMRFKDYDAIICVGDVCDNREMGKLYGMWFKRLKKDKDLAFEDLLKEKGINKREEKAIDRRSFEAGKNVLKYLDSLGKPVFFVPGNWDQSFVEVEGSKKELTRYQNKLRQYKMLSAKRTNPKLLKGLKNVMDCQFALHEFKGLNIVGYGLTNGVEKPMGKLRKEVTKKQFENLKKRYKKLVEPLFEVYSKRDKKLPTVFISHSAPYGTKLDIVLNKESYVYKKHLGSTVSRDFITKYKPMLCVSGHLHEHYGKDRIGKTAVINAGCGSEALVLMEIDEKKGKVKRIKFNEYYRKK